MSGKFVKEEHFPNKKLILLTLSTFQLDIPGIFSSEEQLKNSPLKSLILLVVKVDKSIFSQLEQKANILFIVNAFSVLKDLRDNACILLQKANIFSILVTFLVSKENFRLIKDMFKSIVKIMEDK